jgi:hypothetical protein
MAQRSPDVQISAANDFDTLVRQVNEIEMNACNEQAGHPSDEMAPLQFSPMDESDYSTLHVGEAESEMKATNDCRTMNVMWN